MSGKLPDPVFDDDNPEWTQEDFKRATPLEDMIFELAEPIRRLRGAQKAPTKVPVSVREP